MSSAWPSSGPTWENWIQACGAVGRTPWSEYPGTHEELAGEAIKLANIEAFVWNKHGIIKEIGDSKPV